MSTSRVNWFNIFVFKKGKPHLFVIFVCLLTNSFLGGIIPRLNASLHKAYEGPEFSDVLLKLALLFMGIYVTRVFYQLGVNRYIYHLIQRVRLECYSRWLNAHDVLTGKRSNYERYPQGEVLARVMSDSESVRELVTSGTFSILIDLFFVVSALIGFLTLSSSSGFALAGIEVVLSILLIWGSKYMRKIFLAVRKSRGEVSRAVANVMGGVSESYYTRHDNYASKKCYGYFEDFLSKQLRSNFWDASYYSAAESLYPLLLLMVAILIPHTGITQAAVVFAMVDLIQRSIDPIKGIAGKIANVQRAITGFQRIGEFLEDFEKEEQMWRKLPVKEIHSDFKKLEVSIDDFSYGNSERKSFSLENIAFEGNKGELLGIVGISGSGKSTLLNILALNIVADKFSIDLKFDDENENIHFSSDNLEEAASYRRVISLVSQESHIFSESLAFNITLQSETPQEFYSFWEWVAKQIPYIKRWGINAESKIDPSMISLGQKQLLAALRSCYLKKPIVLFDEISSGLDSELELALREAVLLTQKNSLTILVAHRLETVIQSQNILVMKDGKLADSGSHEVLMSSSQVYREFVKEISHN